MKKLFCFFLFFCFVFGFSKQFQNFNHIVKKKETIYGISKKYSISIDEIKKNNFFLKKRNLQIGDILIIKIIDSNIISEKKENKLCIQSKSKKKNKNFDNLNVKKIISNQDNVINLVIFLPYKENLNNFLSKISKEFFIGAKIALDSISKNGQKINLRLVDCSEDKLLNNFLNKYDFSNIDLIIGPFKKDNLLKVSDKLVNYNIPIISPLSNSNEYELKKNIISSEPLTLFMREKILTEILQAHNKEKIYLIYGSEEEKKNAIQFSDKLKKNKKNIFVQIINNIEFIETYKNFFTNEKKLIIITLMSKEKKIIDRFLQDISIFDPNKIKLFSIYYHENFEFNIYKLFLKKAQLIYTIKRKINLNGIDEQQTLKKFKQEYCIKPSKYSVIGFDVTYDAIKRILRTKGFDFFSVSTRLATKFDYTQQKPYGAYYNKGFRLVKMKK